MVVPNTDTSQLAYTSTLFYTRNTILPGLGYALPITLAGTLSQSGTLPILKGVGGGGQMPLGPNYDRARFVYVCLGSVMLLHSGDITLFILASH